MSATTKLAFARGLFGVAGLISLGFLTVMAVGAIRAYAALSSVSDTVETQPAARAGFLPMNTDYRDLDFAEAVTVHIDAPAVLLISIGLWLAVAAAWRLDPARGRHWLGKLSSCAVLLFSVSELALAWSALRVT